jgi:integrase
MRISEELALVDADDDLRSGVLTIRPSKFGKSRLVPIHPSQPLIRCANASRLMP